MVNPVIEEKKGKAVQEEGCLSVPGACIKITRSKDIVVSFLNENGAPVRMQVKDLLARAMQHEIDHLNGVLIVDYLNPVKKMLLMRKISHSKQAKHNNR
jgi:peptide deformylase